MSLDRLLGSWNLSMDHSQLDVPVTGRQRYERVLDGAFVKMTWSYDRPDFPDAIAMLDEHRYHYFDVRGVIRVFDFEIDDVGWRMTWLAPEFSQRSVARFDGDDRIDVLGDRSDDEGATWTPDFRTTLTRAS